MSEKAAQSEKEMTAISELKVGDVVEGDVSGVVDFGAFGEVLPFLSKGSGYFRREIGGVGAYFRIGMATY